MLVISYLPNEKALRATKSNLVRFEAEREFLEKRNAEAAAKAKDEGSDLDGKAYVVIRQAGETGALVRLCVASRDVAEIMGDEVKRCNGCS